jgi:hypothetical protein
MQYPIQELLNRRLTLLNNGDDNGEVGCECWAGRIENE